jgi:hypothetical protein
MHPAKVTRQKVRQLTDLPNIGKAGAADLRLLDIQHPTDLIGRDPYQMYQQLCQLTGHTHDPCVIDVFIAVTRFMAGEPPQPWWFYTQERKQQLTGRPAAV